MNTSVSMKYYLKNAFDYELRNFVEIEIERLKRLEELSEEQEEELEKLLYTKKHLLKRMEEFKVS